MDKDAKVKIDILFKEYDALRAEIVSRIGSAFGMWNVAGAAAAVWAALQTSSVQSWIVLGIAVVLLALVWLANELATRRCARRVGEIEKKINDLVGERLLNWESRWGAVASGYLKA